MMKEIILPITPFNSLWFKDCFHMALLPVLSQILGNADCIKYNQFFHYVLTEEGIAGFNNEFNNIFKIMRYKDINFYLEPTNDIISEITQALLAKYYVVVGIDNYYEEKRKDFFNKEHNGHSITIFGSNIKKESFWALEQPFFYSYNYSEMEIKQGNIELGYQSFLNNIENNDFFYNTLSPISRINGRDIPSSCFISGEDLSREKKDNLSISNYVNKYLENRQNIYKNLENIKLYERDFEYYYIKCADPTVGSKSINNLSKLINDKRIEFYLMNNIVNIGNGGNENNDVINYWTQIRSYISKFVYSHVINKEHIYICQQLIKDIYYLKKTYYSKIFKKLKKM